MTGPDFRASPQPNRHPGPSGGPDRPPHETPPTDKTPPPYESWSTPATHQGRPTQPIRVLLVEDQALVRAGFRMVIDSQPDLTVVGEAGDGLNGVHQARTLRPDLVVMDVRMPVLGGIEATRQILALPTPPRVVVLTTFDLDEYALAAVRAGASGFVLKGASAEELLTALRAVHAGDAVLAPPTTRRLLDQLAPPVDPAAVRLVEALTARERQVLTAMARGRPNADIAVQLCVAEGTVKTHVGQILAKLGVRDRVQAVVLAYEAGVVRPGER